MGGKAFQDQFACPRMSPAKYAFVEAHLMSELLQLFHHVEVPKHAPEKKDFGDVDIILCRPRTELGLCTSPTELEPLLKQRLRATSSRLRNGLLYYCIRMSQLDGHGKFDSLFTEWYQQYVQVDIQIVTAPSQMAWALFNCAYGDMSNILEEGLRASGIAFTQAGLSIHISQYSSHIGPGSLLFLSNDVSQILHFLGLDKDKFDRGFSSIDDMFTYVASARFFQTRFDCHSHPDLLQRLKHRSCGLSRWQAYKAQKRPEFLRFFFEWYPQNFSELCTSSKRKETGSTDSRSSVLEEALICFEATSRYHVKLQAIREMKSENEFWARVRSQMSEIMTPHSKNGEELSLTRINRTIIALRRFTVFKQRDGGALIPALAGAAELDNKLWATWTNHPGGFTEDELLYWIKENWARAYERDRARTRGSRHAKKLAVAERKMKKLDLENGDRSQIKKLEMPGCWKDDE